MYVCMCVTPMYLYTYVYIRMYACMYVCMYVCRMTMWNPMTCIQNVFVQNQQNKNKSGKKALKSSLPSRAVKEALVKAVPARSLVTGVTGVFSFLRQTGFDKVAQGAFLVFQAAPSDVSSWMFGDSVMLGDVYYRCERGSKATYVLVPLMHDLRACSINALPLCERGSQSDARALMHCVIVPLMHYLSACSIHPLSAS